MSSAAREETTMPTEPTDHTGATIDPESWVPQVRHLRASPEPTHDGRRVSIHDGAGRRELAPITPGEVDRLADVTRLYRLADMAEWHVANGKAEAWHERHTALLEDALASGEVFDSSDVAAIRWTLARLAQERSRERGKAIDARHAMASHSTSRRSERLAARIERAQAMDPYRAWYVAVNRGLESRETSSASTLNLRDLTEVDWSMLFSSGVPVSVAIEIGRVWQRSLRASAAAVNR